MDVQILVSFCNIVPGEPTLALVDPQTLAVRVLEPFDSHSEGVTGLAASEQYIYAAEPHTNRIRIFDRRNMDLVATIQLRDAADIHSLWVSAGVLYVVSTGTDAVLTIEVDGAEVVSQQTAWRMDPTGPFEDVHHINAICDWNGCLLVSGFGKKSGPLWSSATNGFIFDITNSRFIATGIYHPHSLALLGHRLFYCESGRQVVRAIGSDRSQHLPGYARGLCIANGKLFAATSMGRRVSKSTRAVTTTGSGERAAMCAITRLDPDTLEPEAVVDLSAYGREIYDLLPVSTADTAGWRFSDEVSWRNRAIQGLRALLDELESALAVRTEASGLPERDRGWLEAQLAEQTAWAQRSAADVAQRDALIRDLQAQLAEQTAWAQRSAADVAQRDALILDLQARLQESRSAAQLLQDELNAIYRSRRWRLVSALPIGRRR